MNDKITVADLLGLVESKVKFSAVSCYDYTTASLVAEAGVEMIVVGDSAAQIMLGYNSTLPATMDFMVAVTAAVRRGAPGVCLTGDMPFLSYQVSVEEAVRNAGRFIVEGGVDLVKIEATSSHLDVIEAVSNADIPVMAHIGIRPQSIAKTGKLKAEGTTAQQGAELIELADMVIGAGASVLLLEGTARQVSAIITDAVSVPVLGCGSGPDCDGQVLLVSDILGLSRGPAPKFSKNFANFAPDVIGAVKDFKQQVLSGEYPDDPHSYHMKSGQLEELQEYIKTRKRQ